MRAISARRRQVALVSCTALLLGLRRPRRRVLGHLVATCLQATSARCTGRSTWVRRRLEVVVASVALGVLAPVLARSRRSGAASRRPRGRSVESRRSAARSRRQAAPRAASYRGRCRSACAASARRRRSLATALIVRSRRQPRGLAGAAARRGPRVVGQPSRGPAPVDGRRSSSTRALDDRGDAGRRSRAAALVSDADSRARRPSCGACRASRSSLRLSDGLVQRS
jgi:hypothetical protein